MLIAVGDTETTGLLSPDRTPGDHRIIEAYVGLWDYSSRKKVDGLLLRIDPQRSIQPAAQAVHKITLADLAGCPTWDMVAMSLRDALERGDLVVGHNWDGFDAPFIDGELGRIGLPALTKPTFDTMLKGRFASPFGEVPSLEQLCWSLDVPYDREKAHAADYDVDRTADCFFRGIDWGWFKIGSEIALAA